MRLARLILGCMIALVSVSGAPLIFYGFDLGLGEDTPLAAFPNSLAEETEFKSLLTASETETFDSFPAGPKITVDLAFPGTTATLNGGLPASISSVPAGKTNGVGRYAVSGTNFWQTSTENVEISFSNPVIAFGFYGIDIGDWEGDLIISVGGVNYDLNTANRPGGSVLFWGIIDEDNPFTKVSFNNSRPGSDFFGFDNMTVSTEAVVPEPSTFALVIGGAALAALVRRLRR